MQELKVKRVYQESDAADGIRILVDRMWPRGISKDRMDAWIKSVAPSSELRKHFHDGTLSFEQFKEKMVKELEASDTAQAFKLKVREVLHKSDVTLLFAAKDEEHNNAVVLKGWILG